MTRARARGVRRRLTAEGVLSFLLWFAGMAAIVYGVTASEWQDVLIGVLCIGAGEVTASKRVE